MFFYHIGIYKAHAKFTCVGELGIVFPFVNNTHNLNLSIAKRLTFDFDFAATDSFTHTLLNSKIHIQIDDLSKKRFILFRYMYR